MRTTSANTSRNRARRVAKPLHPRDFPREHAIADASASAAELGAPGPTTVQEIIGALVAQGDRRDPNGRFASQNTGRLLTLEHSGQLRAALAPLKADLVQRVRVQLAADTDDAPETLLGLIDAYAEARLLRSSAFIRLAQLGGFVTAKGKARALLATWGSAFDKELRAAERLGLVRRARRAQSPDEWLATTTTEDTERDHTDDTPANDEARQVAGRTGDDD